MMDWTDEKTGIEYIDATPRNIGSYLVYIDKTTFKVIWADFDPAR